MHESPLASLREDGEAAAAAADKRTDFFIVGNSKSGTSALHDFLDQHPGICMSSPKEPNFFATDFCHNVDIGAFKRKSLTEYRDCFDDPSGEKTWGEASACYLYSKDAAYNIHSFNPEAKIIAIFREPISFLHSYHLQQLKNPVSEGETVKDFETALELEDQRKRGEAIPTGCIIPELLFYSERVKYSDQLSRFRNLFGDEQVSVFIYEEFKKDNETTYLDIVNFIGVNTGFRPEFKKKNKGQRLKSKHAQRFMHQVSHGKGAWSDLHDLLKSMLPKRTRRFLMQQAFKTIVFGPKGEVSPELRARLKRRFKPEVERFSELVERDMVTEWGYESV